MRVRQFLLGWVVAAAMAAGAAPALADWDHHDQGGWNNGHWNGGGGGHSYDDWQDHGWMGDDRRWHWFPGWGPGVPVYAAPTLPPEYYDPPPPPPPSYAPPPAYFARRPPVYMAPPPAIIISPGGIGIGP
ncbi:MAG: hypothetical protein KGL65_03785 [Rhodospirillales bacterium]|nr:hypothetical protein [Rhodospirillales bacterium]